jgi:hypothetical protein
MLIMDTWFGISGLIAAPIYYAYLNDDLAMRKTIPTGVESRSHRREHARPAEMKRKKGSQN